MTHDRAAKELSERHPAHEVGKLLPKETPRGVFEYRVKAALSVAHMSPKVTFEVILLALQCYESDSTYGEVRS